MINTILDYSAQKENVTINVSPVTRRPINRRSKINPASFWTMGDIRAKESSGYKRRFVTTMIEQFSHQTLCAPHKKTLQSFLLLSSIFIKNNTEQGRRNVKSRKLEKRSKQLSSILRVYFFREFEKKLSYILLSVGDEKSFTICS